MFEIDFLHIFDYFFSQMPEEKRSREVPGLLDFFGPGTTGPQDLQSV